MYGIARCMDALCFWGCIQPAGCDGALERIILSVALYTHGGCFFIGKWMVQRVRKNFSGSENTNVVFFYSVAFQKK